MHNLAQGVCAFAEPWPALCSSTQLDCLCYGPRKGRGQGVDWQGLLRRSKNGGAQMGHVPAMQAPDAMIDDRRAMSPFYSGCSLFACRSIVQIHKMSMPFDKLQPMLALIMVRRAEPDTCKEPAEKLQG